MTSQENTSALYAQLFCLSADRSNGRRVAAKQGEVGALACEAQRDGGTHTFCWARNYRHLIC